MFIERNATATISATATAAHLAAVSNDVILIMALVLMVFVVMSSALIIKHRQLITDSDVLHTQSWRLLLLQTLVFVFAVLGGVSTTMNVCLFQVLAVRLTGPGFVLPVTVLAIRLLLLYRNEKHKKEFVSLQSNVYNGAVFRRLQPWTKEKRAVFAVLSVLFVILAGTLIEFKVDGAKGCLANLAAAGIFDYIIFGFVAIMLVVALVVCGILWRCPRVGQRAKSIFAQVAVITFMSGVALGEQYFCTNCDMVTYMLMPLLWMICFLWLPLLVAFCHQARLQDWAEDNHFNIEDNPASFDLTTKAGFEGFMQTPIGYDAVLDVLEKEFASENLLFCKEVQVYKLDPSFQAAQTIFDRFMAPDALLAVNVSCKTTKQIVQMLGEPKEKFNPEDSGTVFDGALGEVLGMLHRNLGLLRRCYQTQQQAQAYHYHFLSSTDRGSSRSLRSLLSSAPQTRAKSNNGSSPSEPPASTPQVAPGKSSTVARSLQQPSAAVVPPVSSSPSASAQLIRKNSSSTRSSLQRD